MNYIRLKELVINEINKAKMYKEEDTDKDKPGTQGDHAEYQKKRKEIVKKFGVDACFQLKDEDKKKACFAALDAAHVSDEEEEETEEEVEEASTGGRMAPKKRIRGGKQIVFRKKKKNVAPKFISRAAARKRARKSARTKKGSIHKIIRKQKKSFKKGRRLGLY